MQVRRMQAIVSTPKTIIKGFPVKPIPRRIMKNVIPITTVSARQIAGDH